MFTEELREYFGTYGEIESINVKTDPNTGRSRGFAFIVFNSAEAIDKVVAAGDHVINNKKVDPKKAKARHGKIFVGGLSNDLTDDDIKSYFNQFGTVRFFLLKFLLKIIPLIRFRLSKWKCLLIRQRTKEKVSALLHLNLSK